MAHYAFLDDDNYVTEVISGKEENENGIDWETYYGNIRGQRCLRTSYNTQAGVHTNGGIPFRKNYASVGYFYDENLDAFIPPKAIPSWILDEESGTWKAPKPKPDGVWLWDEDQLDWIAVDPQP